MKLALRPLLAAAFAAVAGVAAAQTDHDNIDAGRPLRFDDAEPVAFRTMALEYGLGANFARNRRPGLDGTFEFIYGLNLNGQLEFGLSPVIGGRADSRNTFGAIEAYDVAYLHSFRQEIRNMPAIAMKVEASFPGTAGDKPNYRLRGIATKTVGSYDRIHLNLDADFQPDAPAGTRKSRLGGVIGYTRPIGYPREFNTTALAEIAFLPGVQDGQGTTVSLGFGVRRQISPRSVLDFGIQSDVAPGRGVNPTPVRLVAGYSTSF